MSTSDRLDAAGRGLNVRELESAIDPVGQGLPDPAILQQMANEFFRAGPGVTPPAEANANAISPAISLAPATSTIAPPVTIPSTSAVPTLASAGAVPASVPGVVAQPPVSALPLVADSSAPGIPGGFSLGDLPSAPGYSFLSEARSIFATPPAAPVHGVPTSLSPNLGIPFEGELRNPAIVVPPAVNQPIPASTADLAHPTLPQIAGAPTKPATADSSLGFLDALNPIVAIDVIPTLGPVSENLGPLPHGNLSSIPFDVEAVRRDFPILNERVNGGKKLIWLDNAATTQKPQAVIDRLSYFYQHENSNIHRAAHALAARSTDAYEGAREKVRRFLNAGSVNEIIFVRGATEGINLISQSWGRRNIQKDDEIIVSHLEHHANIVPWQMLCAEKGARLRVAPVDNTGQILLDEYEKLFNARTKLVSIAHVSNALGTVTPIHELVEIAHRHGAKIVVDGAQAVSHMQVDVQSYDCDFYIFSGHKVFAPTGIGVVYGKQDVLAQTPPWQGGGNMISDVTFEKTLYHAPPMRFEAGTGNIADAVGLGAAIDYLDRIGMANVARYEHELLVYGTEQLLRIPGIKLIGTAREKASVLSFVLDGFRTEEVGQHLSNEGIAVRSGHHCAQPILRRFGQESTVRPSLAFYNTCEEIDALVAAIWNLKAGRITSVV